MSRREYDKDGYYTIPKTNTYPGLVAKKVDEDKEIISFGDPDLAKKAIELRIQDDQG